MRHKLWLLATLCASLNSCVILHRQIYDDAVPEDQYRFRSRPQAAWLPFYAVFAGDTLRLYGCDTLAEKRMLTQPLPKILPLATNAAPDIRMTRTSLDLDLFTTPFKYRPKEANIPAQLNADFNASIFAGSRWDRYHYFYNQTPAGSLRRRLTHYGFSLGGFGGLGRTLVSPTTTLGRYTGEYDGLALQGGAAVLVAVNRVNTGLALGADFLTDARRNEWAYQGKPWLGVVITFNIN